ncbi:monocarboxylate transporter 13-like isoform X3 [Artemia franciscana]|uniref:Major facilitator superfamily (MFS) profile domain-containing protein n=1 Tax=Artemia franciscana TaxID=6661 RepID=A0AA88LAC9_ARTSF|nr:hypothetical protein QYM36_006778 [Artemia franciscana]
MLPSTREELRRRFVPPDGGYGWFIVFGAFFAQFWITGLIRSFGVLLLEIFVLFEGSSITLGAWIPAILATFTLTMSPITGALCERFSERVVMFIGSVLCCIGFILSCFVTRIEHLLVTVGVISGLGAGLSLLPGVLITSRYFKTKRALANGICVSGTACGGLIMPRVIQLLVAEFGLRGTFLLLGGGILQVCISAALLRPTEVHQRIVEIDEKRKKLNGEKKVTTNGEMKEVAVEMNDTKKESGEKNTGLVEFDLGTGDKLAETSAELTETEGKGSKKKFCLQIIDWSLLKSPSFLLCSTTVGLMAMCNPHFLYYMPSYVTEKGIVTKSEAATLVSIGAAIDMFGRIGSGWLADRNFIPLGKMYALCFLVAGTAPLILPFATNMIVLGILCSLFGLAAGFWFLLVPTLLTEYHGVEKISSSYGLARLFQGVMTFCSPLLIGFILNATDSYNAAFFMMSGCLFLASFLVFTVEPWILRHHRRDQS